MDWKKEIDDAIAKEPLLTEEAIRRMQQPKRKRRPPYFVVAAALVLLAITAVFLFNKPEEQTATPKPEAEKKTEQLVRAYFEAALNEDYAQLEKVSAMEITASPKEIMYAYEKLDPLNYSVLKMTEHEDVDVLTLRIPAKEGEDSFVRHYTIDQEAKKVSEQLYADVELYQPFVHPEKIPLTYEAAQIAEGAELPIETPLEERVLAGGERITAYDSGQLLTFYIESARGTFKLGDLEKSKVWHVSEIPSIEERVIAIATEQAIIYVFYSEVLGGYQTLTGERQSVDARTVEEIGHTIFVVASTHYTLIGLIEDGQLRVANVNQNLMLSGLYQEQLIDIEATGSLFLLKYVEEYEQRSSYYKFENSQMLVKQ